jgi:hypothetical protein
MKSKFHYSLATLLTCITLLCGATAVQAATITLNPMDSNQPNGASFDVKVVGLDFTDGTIGGGFSLMWDPSILRLDNVNLVFPGDKLFGQAGAVDNTAGTLLNADVTSFTGTNSASFDIAVLTFTALSPGLSALDISVGLFGNGSDRLWADASGFVDTMPDFKDGSVTVVPVPAAVWLFGSGLLGLIGVARRKAA